MHIFIGYVFLTNFRETKSRYTIFLIEIIVCLSKNLVILEF